LQRDRNADTDWSLLRYVPRHVSMRDFNGGLDKPSTTKHRPKL